MRRNANNWDIMYIICVYPLIQNLANLMPERVRVECGVWRGLTLGIYLFFKDLRLSTILRLWFSLPSNRILIFERYQSKRKGKKDDENKYSMSSLEFSSTECQRVVLQRNSPLEHLTSKNRKSNCS